MIRLGLCCKFLKRPIKFRTTTVTFLKKIKSRGEDPNDYLNEILKHNVQSLEEAIDYCALNSIGSFRVGSEFFPSITHPDIRYELSHMKDEALLKKGLEKCKKKAKEKNIRLTFHPSQFVLLTSPNETVTQNSIADLNYHADLSEMIGADVINIHMGGAYNNKPLAIERFEKNYLKLSEEVRSRLTLENDDKVYSPEEILPTCKKLNIPLVYDVHHHRCYSDNLSVEEATQQALLTWNREPLFHISSPIEGWGGAKPSRHHDFIFIDDFPDCWRSIDQLTVEIEAKAKEEAIKKLYYDLKERGWEITQSLS